MVLYIIKKSDIVTDNPPIRIYVSKIEIRISFKIKTVYYLDFLTHEIMKLLGGTKNIITKDQKDKNEPLCKFFSSNIFIMVRYFLSVSSIFFCYSQLLQLDY